MTNLSHNNQQNQDPLKKLNWIQQHHADALVILDWMFQRNKNNLIKRGYPPDNAAVNRKEWRECMEWRFRCDWRISQEIEHSLAQTGLLFFFGGYVKRIEDK